MIFCFKGISNRLYLFGLQPIDVLILLVLFVFIHGIFNSFIVDIIIMSIAYYIAKKFKSRPKGYFLSLYMYFSSPPMLVVPKHLEIK